MKNTKRKSLSCFCVFFLLAGDLLETIEDLGKYTFPAMFANSIKKFANYIVYNNKILIENMRKKETIYIGDSTESMESNIVLK